MLLSLGLRGVSFEFRYQTVKARPRWDAVFAVGSILAAFSQGAFVGGLIMGVAVDKGAFVGRPFDWLTPFSVLLGSVRSQVTQFMELAGCTLKAMEGQGSSLKEFALDYAGILVAQFHCKLRHISNPTASYRGLEPSCCTSRRAKRRFSCDCNSHYFARAFVEFLF